MIEVADRVWVRQSAWVWSNAIAVRGWAVIMIDPGIDGSELNELADDVTRLGIPVVAGFSTHLRESRARAEIRRGQLQIGPRIGTLCDRVRLVAGI